MKKRSLLFVYVAGARGFYNQAFNFSTAEQFSITYSNDKIILQKCEYNHRFPKNFWAPNISEISLLIGENASGKTTIMQIICQWVGQLADGKFPEERGILVFSENNVVWYIAFDNGKRLTIAADEDLHLFSEDSELVEYFNNVKLIYYSNTMTELYLDNSEIVSDFSLRQRIEDAVSQEYLVGTDIMANYRRNEFIRWYEFHEQIRSQTAFGKNIKEHDYIYIKINSGYFEEIILKESKQGNYILEGLSELWKCYFIRYIKDDYQERVSFPFALLQAVFQGIICSLVKWDQSQRTSPKEITVVDILERIVRSEYTSLRINKMNKGEEWIKHFFKDLFTDYRMYFAKDEFNCIWGVKIEQKLNKFLDFLFGVIELNENCEQIESVDEWEVTRVLTYHQKSVWQTKSDTSFASFWEVYKEIFYYVETVNFEWNASSGEKNQEGLFSIFLNEFNGENIWLFLDEPDNTFHPDLTRDLMNTIVQKFRIQNRINFQIWISTHSPIMLSDIPGESVIYLHVNGKRKEVITPPFKDTFGQNIYVLFDNAFFLKNGVVGSFATNKIMDIFKKLQNIEIQYMNNNYVKDMDFKCLEECEKEIDLISEPIIKNQMQKLLSKLNGCRK